MNQLAIVIKQSIKRQEDIQSFTLTTTEFVALKSMEAVNRMSPVELADYLKQQDDPVDWLINLTGGLTVKANQ
jgi:hypothetical protein